MLIECGGSLLEFWKIFIWTVSISPRGFDGMPSLSMLETIAGEEELPFLREEFFSMLVLSYQRLREHIEMKRKRDELIQQAKQKIKGRR